MVGKVQTNKQEIQMVEGFIDKAKKIIFDWKIFYHLMIFVSILDSYQRIQLWNDNSWLRPIFNNQNVNDACVLLAVVE